MSLLPAMLTIQAIKTRYNGYKFLSRLEAHWAVFFDTLGIKYHPELEGYALKYTGSQNVVCYLPDFWIPEMQSYFEIKPALGNSLNESMPTPQECEKVIRLCIGTQKSVCILVGDVWPGAYRIIEYSPLSPEKIKRLMETINWVDSIKKKDSNNYAFGQWLTPNRYFYMPDDGSSFMYADFNRGFECSLAWFFICGICKKVLMYGNNGLYAIHEHDSTRIDYIPISAYETARSYRFERWR